jgi:protein-disulfide isomerase
MTRIDRRIAVSAVLALALTSFGAAPAPGPQQIRPDDMVMGSPKAKLTVIEYASASCSHCARFNNDVFPAFKAKYIDTGKVRYVLREFLTEPVEIAAAGFLLARCVKKDRYFNVVDQVFRQQDTMFKTGEVREVLLKIGKDNGITEAQYMACLTNKAAKDALFKKVDGYAAADKIQYTPTFLIGDQRLEGERSLADMDAAIAKAQSGK